MIGLNRRPTGVFVVEICTGPMLAGRQIHGTQQESQSNPYYEGGRIYSCTQNFLYCIGGK